MSGFEPIGTETTFTGNIITVGMARFRHSDGEIVSREKVWHPGAVGILAVDDQQVWLTRQPREVAGLTASLEIPAGKLDVPGEAPLAAARRELDEEIAKAAGAWEEIEAFYSSPGFTDERVWLFLARDLSDTSGEARGEEDQVGDRQVGDRNPQASYSDLDQHASHSDLERIEIVPWPLAELDAAIAESEDAKTIIALLWLARQLASGQL